jgi:4-hydroxybenzoate polyprenyltransferase
MFLLFSLLLVPLLLLTLLLFPLLLVALLLLTLLLFPLLLVALLLLLLQSRLSKHRRSRKQSQCNAKQEHSYAFGSLSKGFGS